MKEKNRHKDYIESKHISVNIFYSEAEVLELLKKYIKELDEAFKGKRFMPSMEPKSWLEMNNKQ